MTTIVPLEIKHFEQAVALGNLVHGDNYLDLAKLTAMQKKALKNGINANFVAIEDEHVIGLRLSYAASNWPLDKWCTTSKWPCAQADMAYFKCIAISPEHQGKGIGPQLLTASINALKSQGAKAGIAHLWMQSPGNGAVKYFTKAGGVMINEHKNRWLDDCINDGYICTICGNRCSCSAAEMALVF